MQWKALFSELRAIGGEMLDVLFPRYCMICGKLLMPMEHHLCTSCFVLLPFTRLHGRSGNVVERLFWGRIPIRRANAFLFYEQCAPSRYIFFNLKYNDRPAVGRSFGRIMARDLIDTDFFASIDLIIPLPLHPYKLRRRGYNQSEELARGIAAVTGLPVVTDAVVRVRDTPTQTRLTVAERRANVCGAFRLMRPDAVAGRHVLLVDDVLTTNATLTACAEAIMVAPNVSFSVLVMGLAGRHGTSGLSYSPWWREEGDVDENEPDYLLHRE